MIDIIRELREIMEEKRISAEIAGLFVGVTGQEIRRWLKGEFIPTLKSRKKIRLGIRRMRRTL
jgi:hypothetical protein